MTVFTLRRRQVGLLALASALGPAAIAAGTDPLAPMVRFDALYIPVLSLTSAAQADAAAAPRARAAAARLHQAWPALHKALADQPPSTAQQAAWQRALQQAGQQMAEAEQAIARNDWAHAHEALEPVRIGLMTVRQAAGFDYVVDRLTAFHAPMEELVLAAGKGSLAGMEPVFARAAALWRAVESQPVDAVTYRLSPQRQAQLRAGLAAEGLAMSRLSDALRGSDNAAALAAAKAIKPPFARVFTAFGLADGESLP